MMDALIAGKLHARPEERTSAKGGAFATARLRAVAGDGESLFVNCIAFEPQAMAALLALDVGDAVSVAGSITPKVWTDREGTTRPALDIVVARVLTSYHVQRRCGAMAPGASGGPQQRPHQGSGPDDGSEPLDF
ncbi:single-stranded DNA-binding protein [Melaminivora sp.]|uniref:single-stranded DNA-binding protein n=1 Tax=Melaminivora sp. TaxID=1933032 RepID=UPI0028A9989F|nr:single-stranded DNA-binding protein [Melaminivora sp.]